MASIPEAESPSTAPDLRAFYESSLRPYLMAQDSRVRATQRNRWLVLVLGLAIAAVIISWAWQSDSDSEFGPMAGFGLAVVSIGYFWFAKAGLADDLRHELMGRIAKFLGLRYEPAAADSISSPSPSSASPAPTRSGAATGSSARWAGWPWI